MGAVLVAAKAAATTAGGDGISPITVANTAKHGSAYLMGVVGLCGGFTTFSLEVVMMLRSGQDGYGVALAYVALSVVLCIAGTYIGLKLTQ